ncbi:MAG: hypothetical protein HY651_03670 [Acidobacteria bacterium]|nr:hypothetical protein [Acidobacteriota bacterium]
MRLKNVEILRRLSVALLLGLLHSSTGLLCAQALPDGEGKALVAATCTQCHGVKAFAQLRDGVGGWKNMVEEMVLRGAQLSPAEADTVVRYLVENYGPAAGPFRTGALPPKSALANSPVDSRVIVLPAGPGKDVVQQRCGLCHDLGRVITVRRSAAEWERITRNMIERGPQATPEAVQAIVSYLTSQFGR